MTELHPSHTLVLKSAKMITPSVRHLSFMRDDGLPIQFEPGQFMTFQYMVSDKKVRRSYSIASIPGRDETIDIAISYIPGGISTTLLFDLKPGEHISAIGPYGRLVLEENEPPQRYILVATGTGVAPYRSMIPLLIQRIEQAQKKVIVMLGVQTRDDLLYGNDFTDVAAQYQSYFEFHAYYSRSQGVDLLSHEHCGRVQSGFENFYLEPANDIIYLCGNPNMIDDAFETLKKKGFQSHHIKREKYFSSK